jgi:hypothetical protein
MGLTEVSLSFASFIFLFKISLPTTESEKEKGGGARSANTERPWLSLMFPAYFIVAPVPANSSPACL